LGRPGGLSDGSRRRQQQRLVTGRCEPGRARVPAAALFTARGAAPLKPPGLHPSYLTVRRAGARRSL